MRGYTRISNTSFAAALLALAAFIATPASFAGSISGRVIDAETEIYLDGVIVRVEGTDLRTVTERGGSYTLPDVPNGQQTVRFESLGYQAQTLPVNVQSTQTARLDASLQGDFYELEGVVVQGSAIGQVRALNFQKNADAYANVVAADAIGRFPDQNAAEALSRLPGVSIERDQGEGRFVVVRGINPNLNSVAVDGVKLASPSTGERATLLDTIPTDTLQQLEVYKTILPSHPGDSVGAYINIKTPSAFDQQDTTARLAIQGNYSNLVSELRGKISGAYGDTFAEGTVGFMVTASYEEREFGSDNNESDPWEEEDGEDGSSGFVSSEMELREYDLVRARRGLSSNLEVKPSEDQYYFLRASYSEYEDTEIRHAGILEPDAFDQIAPDSFVGLGTEFVREIKDRTEKMNLFTLSAGGESRFDSITIDYTLSQSTADEDTPYDFEAIYEFVDTVDIRFSDTRSPVLGLSQLAGPSLMEPANYEFDEVVVSNQLVEEEDLSGELNFTWDLSDTGLTSVKAGALLREKEKTSDLEEFESDDNPEAVDDLSGFVNQSPRDGLNNNLPLTSPRISTFFQENRSAFGMERADDASAIEDFVSNEDVLAAYLMGEFSVGEWQIIAGARFEDTDFSTSGFEYNDDEGTIVAATGSNGYSNFLPGLHFKRWLDQDTVLRISWSNSISRPNFEQTIPFAEIEGNEVTVGNPELDPLESMNFDASIERYLPALGLLSASLFYKDVENFIYEQTLFGPFRDIPDAEITTFRNGPSGDIQGIEFAAQRRLGFLPAPFDSFGFYANLAFIDGEATALPAEEGDPTREIPFIKQSEMVGNLALTYERGRFFFRVAGTWRDDYLDEVGAEPIEDRYMDSHFQVDISTTYHLRENLSVFANWLNITDEPLEAYWDVSNRLSQFEEYGWSANAGVKWSM